MQQLEMRIADARAAASAFAALGRLTGSARIPSDQAEFSIRIQRATGRARPLAAALGRYVEVNGFDALQSALSEGAAADQANSKEKGLPDSDAAAVISRVDFEELDRTALIFAASGLY